MGHTDDVRESQQDDAGVRHIPIMGETPRLTISASDGALRVLGDDEATEIVLRASTLNEDSLPLDLVAEVEVRPAGQVRIKVRSADEIRREIRRRSRADDREHDDFFGDIGGRLDALTALKRFGGKLERIQLVVTVPARCDVTLSTASGPIQVGRFSGRVQLHSTSGSIDCARLDGNLVAQTTSGSLRLGDITGSVSVQTTSGDVITRNIVGNLVIQTTSGDAQGQELSGQLGFKSQSGELLVRDSRFRGLYFTTTSGNGTIQATLDAGEYEMRTVSGDIALRPQPELNAILSGRTVSGSFRSLLPYRHADDNGRTTTDDDEQEDDERNSDDEHPEISLPGLKIGRDGIDIAGVIRIDDKNELVELPGMRIKITEKRARRRGRNRWEYLLGDPERAASGETRLRVRTVSGDLLIRPGHDTSTTTADSPRTDVASPPAPRRAWPDAELWPEDAHTPERAAAMPPSAPASPTAPPLPTHPETEIASRPAGTPTTDVIALGPPAQGTTASATPTAVEGAEESPTGSAAPTTPLQFSKEETRLEILEALQRGEITTDEALLLLAQLDD